MKNCPQCNVKTQLKESTPCFRDGNMPQELEHLKEGMHTFEMLELLGQRVILCDFCRFDICSHGKDYWGTKRRIRMADVNHVKIIEPQLIKTLVCPQCHQRVDWLEAVEAIRNR